MGRNSDLVPVYIGIGYDGTVEVRAGDGGVPEGEGREDGEGGLGSRWIV